MGKVFTFSGICYNNMIYSSTGKAPFEIVEGVRKVPPFFSTKDKILEANEYTGDLDTDFAKVRETLQKSQERQKKAADRHRRDSKLKENDWIKDISFRLRLPDTWKIHNVFHVNLWKTFGDVPNDGEPGEQPEVEENEEILVPEQVLEHKVTKKGVIEGDYNVFKRGAPVVHNFPIQWSPIGICVETTEDNLNHQTLAQLVNQITLPSLNLVTINVHELVEQEIHANSELGLRLKCAKQDPNEKKKKDFDQQKWLPPSALLLEALKGKISMDQELEHNKEAARRKIDVDNAKLELEAANAELKKAQDEFLSADSSLKSFKSGLIKPKEEVDKTIATKKGASALPKHDKEKNAGALSGKPKVPPDKNVGLEQNDLMQDDTRQSLVNCFNQAKVKCQAKEKKIAEATSFLKNIESKLLAPYTLVQVYILSGLVNDPAFVASLGDGENKILYAILNLRAWHKYDQDAKITEQMTSLKETNSVTRDSVRTKSLAVALKALAKTRGLHDPSRKIAIIDVQYEIPTTSNDTKEVQELKDGNVVEKKAAKPKTKDVESALPYENIAKAMASALQSLVLKLSTYKSMTSKMQYVKVPPAVAFEVGAAYLCFFFKKGKRFYVGIANVSSLSPAELEFSLITKP
ncbi:hypothetical protein L7F22_023077 [Adiantum nelumboides]|nr:hypothetical protein [Adiantum nelumboides]